MTDRNLEKNNRLRQQAEEILKSEPEFIERLGEKEVRAMLQELRISRIELELQNEELRGAQKELESARMRLSRLYNNAPVGYVALDKNGLVLQTNATFARMMGREHSALPGVAFATMLAAEDEAIFRARFKAFFKNPGGKRMEVKIEVTEDKQFSALLEAAPHHAREPDNASREYDELLVTVSDITEKKQVEQQLGEKHEYLATTLHSIGDAVIATDSAGRVSAMNPVAEHLTGWTEAEAAGKNLHEVFSIVNSQTFERAENPVARVLSEGKVVGLANHTMLLARDGRRFQIADSAAPIRKKGEAIMGVVLVFRDVTEEYQKDRLLDEHRTRLAKAQEIANLGSWELDIVNQRLYWSDEVYRIFGLAPKEIEPSYDAFLAMVHPDDREAVNAAYTESVEKNLESYEIEHRVVRRDGVVRVVYEKCEHVRNDEGRIARSVGMVHDITRRRADEKRIAEEKEQLMVTLRSIGDGVITTDTRGRVVIINKIAEDLTGWSQEEAAGEPLEEVFCIVNEFTRKRCDNPVAKVLATGKIIELANHTVLIARDGTERIIADSGAPIKDAHGAVIGVVLVFRDTTEKQKLLDTINRTDKLDSLGILAGGIAHDFNNLLGGIFGYIDLAREASTANKTAVGYIDKALAAFNRAKDLTQQLLTFSKGGSPMRKTCELKLLLKENASFALSGSNVQCDYYFDEDLYLCDVDENQIGQVISNIVLNAQQAMPLGGRIAVQASNIELAEGGIPGLREGAYVKVSITDTGAGIQPEHLKRIFDPFFTTKQKGNGLGLATCYSIVQKHDGHIEAESEPGKGTTFHVLLPAAQGGKIGVLAESTVSHQGEGVMVVMDDEDFIREITGEMLSRMGYTVVESLHGEETIRMCSDVSHKGGMLAGALLDLTIPGGMGGKETIVLMRKSFPDLPIFALSGYSEDPVMAKPWLYGFTDSIRKPFRKRELEEMLDKHMGGRA